MNRLALLARKVITPETVILDGVVLVEGTKILEVGNYKSVKFSKKEFSIWGGSQYCLVPGFIDTHIHGAQGRDVMEGTKDALDIISQSLARHGTTAYLATTITASVEKTLQSVERIGNQIRHSRQGAQLIGIHLEGPFISPEKCGAHPAIHIHPASVSLLEQIITRANNQVKLITLAPEIKGVKDLIHYARSKNIVVSLGHSNSVYKDAQEAISQGASNATHIFNAMRSFNHREPGIIGAILTNPNIWTELIADGIHVTPNTINFLLQSKGTRKLLLITDSISAQGMPDGHYHLGDSQVTVLNGVCRNSEGKLAGSTLTQDKAMRNILNWSKLPLQEIVFMLTKNPAKSLKIEDSKGSLTPGNDADMVLLLLNDLSVHTTIIKGKIGYTIG